MNKELEELDMENWELRCAVKHFRDAYIKLREENKQLKKHIQELKEVK